MTAYQNVQFSLESFTTIIIATQELFNFNDGVEHNASLEAIGYLWGNQVDGRLMITIASVLQRVQKRSEEGVAAVNVFDQSFHTIHTMLDLRGESYQGMFHSHPWPEGARYNLRMNGGGDQDLANASDTDKSSQVEDYVEVICAVRQADSMSDDMYEWRQRDNRLSGKLDTNWYSISAWCKNVEKQVVEVSTTMDDEDICSINCRTSAGYSYNPVMSLDMDELSRNLSKIYNS